MKIKTLELVSFGKFKNRKIHLADRLNLIYGLNEAGKTTIQHFIEGMFFGFLKPYRKKKIYSEYYEQYKPLRDNRYFGVMTYEDDKGREIRLERNFLKNEESLHIYDGLTGEDISDNYPYDPVSRQPLPLGENINAAFYNNTVNIKERGSFSREVMLKEINDRLISKGADKGEEVSIYRAMTELENKRDAIGTLKQKKSNYGEAVTRLHRLEKEKEENDKNRAAANRHLFEIKKMEDKLGALNDAYLKLAPVYQSDDNGKRKQIVQRIESLNEESEKIQSQIKDFSGYRELTDKELSELNYLRQSSESLQQRIEQRQKELLTADRELLEEAQKERALVNSVGFFTKEEVEEDLDALQQKKDRPDQVTQDTNTLNATGANIKIKVYAVVAALIVIGLSLLIVGFVKGGDVLNFVHLLLLGFAAWLLLLSGIGLLVLYRKYPERFSQLTALNPVPEEERVSKIFENTEQDTFREALIKKYAVKNNKNIEAHLKTLLEYFNNLQQTRIRLQFIKEKKDTAQKEKATLEEERNRSEQKVEETLAGRGLQSVEAYDAALQQKDKLRWLENRLDYNRRLYQELEEMLTRKKNTSSEDSREASVRRVEIREEMEQLNKKIGELMYKNESLLKDVRPSRELEDEIVTYRALVDEYSENYKAYTVAIDVLKECASVEKDKLLPKLGEKIGKIFSEISGETTDVKVDPHLNIRVMRGKDGYVPIDTLSSGTVEQLYFAMRFGVQSMTRETLNLPFILDDAFVQYDDRRKETALRFLSEVSGQKQVIIFTCNDSEKQILDKLDLPYYGLVL